MAYDYVDDFKIKKGWDGEGWIEREVLREGWRGREGGRCWEGRKNKIYNEWI